MGGAALCMLMPQPWQAECLMPQPAAITLASLQTLPCQEKLVLDDPIVVLTFNNTTAVTSDDFQCGYDSSRHIDTGRYNHTGIWPIDACVNE